MSLSESLAKFLPNVATALSSDEQSVAIAEIVDAARALEGLAPVAKPVAAEAPAATDVAAATDTEAAPATGG